MKSPSVFLRAKSLTAFGFTLVETALAMGIVSFAMITIMGLIPLGLGSFREAMNVSVEANIAHSLIADIQRKGSPEELEEQLFFFDDQGVKVKERHAVFRAEITPSSPVQAGAILSPEAAGGIRTVMVRITNKINPADAGCYPVLIPLKP